MSELIKKMNKNQKISKKSLMNLSSQVSYYLCLNKEMDLIEEL